MQYRLSNPVVQDHIDGLVFPITWVEENPDAPGHYRDVHTGTIIVKGFVDRSGEVHYDEDDLERKIAEMERMVNAHRNPVRALPKSLEGRIGKVLTVKKAE